MCRNFANTRRGIVAAAKLSPEKMNGGRNRNPTLIANQVELQTKQSKTKTITEKTRESFKICDPFWQADSFYVSSKLRI